MTIHTLTCKHLMDYSENSVKLKEKSTVQHVTVEKVQKQPENTATLFVFVFFFKLHLQKEVLGSKIASHPKHANGVIWEAITLDGWPFIQPWEATGTKINGPSILNRSSNI